MHKMIYGMFNASIVQICRHAQAENDPLGPASGTKLFYALAQAQQRVT